MENIDIWRILLTAGLTAVGFALRYVLMKVQDIVPEKDIRQMIVDAIEPEKVKLSMIYERQIRMEGKIDRLLEDNRNDSGRDSH